MAVTEQTRVSTQTSKYKLLLVLLYTVPLVSSSVNRALTKINAWINLQQNVLLFPYMQVWRTS